jgi:hypothetical protein
MLTEVPLPTNNPPPAPNAPPPPFPAPAPPAPPAETVVERIKLSEMASVVAPGVTNKPWYKPPPLTMTAFPAVLMVVTLLPIAGKELAKLIVPPTVKVIVLPAPLALASMIA